MNRGELIFALTLGHFVCDYALQSDWIAKHKNRHVPSSPPPGQTQQTAWPWILTSHAATHAAMVWLLTGKWWLGAAELVAHWLIDFAKCEGETNIHQDQLLHLACKLLWVTIR